MDTHRSGIIRQVASWAALLVIVIGSAYYLDLFPQQAADRPPSVTQSSTPTPVPSPTIPRPINVCAPSVPQFYADNPADPAQAGPGSLYKEYAADFGPSAIPVGDEFNPDDPQVLMTVLTEFIHRNCTDRKFFQVGYPTMDVRHRMHDVFHPAFSPNRAISDAQWRERLAVYFGAILWGEAKIETVTQPAGSWTLMMVSQPGGEPLVKAVMRAQPAVSHILVLRVMQPDADGVTYYEDRRRLECGFQPVYGGKENVPVVIPVAA